MPWAAARMAEPTAAVNCISPDTSAAVTVGAGAAITFTEMPWRALMPDSWLTQAGKKARLVPGRPSTTSVIGTGACAAGWTDAAAAGAPPEPDAADVRGLLDRAAGSGAFAAGAAGWAGAQTTSATSAAPRISHDRQRKR